MQIAIVGLGRMGYNLALNLLDHKHDVIGYNRSCLLYTSDAADE